MNRRLISVLSVLALCGGAAVLANTPAADAAPALRLGHGGDDAAKDAKRDFRHDRLQDHHVALKKRAIDEYAKGKAHLKGTGKNRKIEMKGGKTVDYPVNQTAELLTFLVDFGNQADPRFPTDPAAGPVHNQIPKPDSSDNSTYWEKDFSPEHYKEMFFTGLKDQNGESFHNVYEEMSSGRFDLEGDVSDWVTVPYSEASYGNNATGGSENNADMTRFIQDSANAWYDQQKAQGKTDAEISDYLAQFDQWDRYDLDGDGNYNEPDGYIDHFQAIHAGTGEEAGAPEWAIWSHRWAVNPNGTQGPDGYGHAGGIKIGNTNFYIRDYTTEPENGGLGVFSHEFGHDLGLPDYYDTAGGDNGTGFWNLMSSGSWMNHGKDTIGTTPDQMGATEKLFLGWYGDDDLAVIDANKDGTVKLGPSYHATTVGKQALLVNLPDGTKHVDVGSGYDGSDGYLYSGNGDDRTATATSPSFTVPAGGTLSAKVAYSIETDWDYAYAEISTDGGATFTPLATNLSTDTSPNSQNDGHGITGASSSACPCNAMPDTWVDLTADLAAYAGKTAQIRFRMVNDAGYHEFGIAVDDVSIGSALSSDFESGFDGWTVDKFYEITGGGYDVTFPQYYLVENRQYLGYDKTLKQGPYSFDYARTAPNKVDHFPYQDGLLIWYANGLYTDNNTSQHPGYGQALPVDAHPASITWSDGSRASSRIQTYDSTFDVDTTDGLRLTNELAAGGTKRIDIRSSRGVSVFDDTDPAAYYDPANPQGSTMVAGTGTKIRVLSTNEKKGQMIVKVTR